MRKMKVRADGLPCWPYGLAGVVLGCVCTLVYLHLERPSPTLARALAVDATQTRLPTTPVAPTARPVATGTAGVIATDSAERDLPPPDQAVADVPASPSAAAPPPYPSPLMPCRRLGDPVAQAVAGPDGPPGYRCRLLNPAAARG